MTDERFAHDAFLISQRVRPVGNDYVVTTLGEDGKSAGEPVAFVRQKRMALREDLPAFEDDSRATELFRVKARKVIDLGGRYDVHDADGGPIGILERRFKRSLIRTTWGVLDPDGAELAWAQERSPVIAFVRRIFVVLDLIPIVNFLPWELVPIPYHFTISAGDTPIGEVRRLLGLKDRYVVDLTGDPARTIDRRMGVALGIALDALQAR